MRDNVWPLILFAAAAIIVIGGLAMLSQHYTLDNIKSRTVGDGQYGTARWATPKEISKTYRNIPFTPQAWRNGKQRPKAQGLVLGSVGKPPVPPELHLFGRTIHPPIPKRLWERQTVHALVDCDDIHCLMIGASGVGKTAFFLYPNLEYACASGMSIFSLDTKGDLARNYGTIAEKYYGYRVSVIDLRNPMHSDGYNLLTLINHYMDLFREFPNAIDYAAAAEKYTKILAKSIINPSGDAAQYGENSYFYEAAEGLMASVTLLLAQYLPPGKDEPDVRHIVSVFKLIQDLLAPDPRSRGRNGFQTLMSLLPDDHKARMLAASALHTSDQAMASVMSTVLSRLNAFLDTELEQVLCFDSSIDAETFASQKCIIFLVLPEEDSTKNFMAGLLIQNLSRELFTVAEKRGGKLANRVVFLCDEFGTMPPFDVLSLFSAGRSRRLTMVPIIQSLAQLEKNYGKEGAEILADNCQDTIFGGFAPNSQTAEVLSKALGSRTVMSGSVSKGKNDPSQSLQMMERALLTPDELKALPKGEFIVMKTGTYPMRTKLRLFLEWGITFEEPYQTPKRAARKVTYAGKQELIHAILHDLQQRQQTECVDEENSSQMVDYNTQKREEEPV